MLTNLILLGLVQAAAAPTPPAAPPPSAAGERREVIVIRETGDKGATADRAQRRIRIVDLPGKPGTARDLHAHGDPERLAAAECENGNRFDTSASGADKDGKKTTTRVVLCTRGTNQVEALEKAAKRIAENKELPSEVRDRVLASMEAEIGRLKAAR